MRRAGLAAALVVAAGLAVLPYLAGLPGEFVYDDLRLIAENEGLVRPFDVRRAFLRDYYASDDDRMGLGYYRPVAILANEWDYRRGGGEPAAFHATNIALHAAATCLVLLLGRALFDRRLVPATCAAALFALHPSHAESVAFISGRVDPLATVFVLLAILLHLGGRRWWAAAIWFLALLSKEIAVTAPLLALTLDTARDGWPHDGAWRVRLRRYLPYAAALAPYLLLRALALGGLLAAPAEGTRATWLHAPVVLGSYLAWLVLPPPGLHLEPGPVSGLGAVLAVAALAAAGGGAVLLARRGRALEAALIVWCLVALLPVAQLRPIETELSERFLYLPSAGAMLLVVTLGARWSVDRRRSAAAVAAVVALAAIYAAILVPRAVAWRDGVRLWSAKAAEDPGSLKAHLNLGRALARRGDIEGARREYGVATRIRPDMAALAQAELEALAGGGDVETIRRAAEANPDGAVWGNLGFRLLETGRASEAANAFRRAVDLVPTRSSGWLGLGLALLRTGDLEGAFAAASRAVELNPDLGLARMVQSESVLRRGDPCEALRLAADITLDEPSEREGLERLRAVARQACPADP